MSEIGSLKAYLPCLPLNSFLFRLKEVMWSENSASVPDPDTLIQFLLTPMTKPDGEQTAPKKNESKV